jgi:hypothetical protein
MLKRIYLTQPWAGTPMAIANGSNENIIITTKKKALTSKNRIAREKGINL